MASSEDDASPLIQRRSLADQAVDSLLKIIERRELVAGDALPSTAELAQLMGVSRNIVREALAELAGQGLIERRQGRESTLTLPDAKQLERLLRLRFAINGADYESLEEYREILETGSARLAASRITPTSADRLAARMKALRDAQSDEELFEADQQFHIEVSRASGNEMLQLALESTNSLLIELRRRAWVGWIQSGESPGAVIEAHQDILDRILEGDSDGAAAAMEINLHQAQSGLAAERAGTAADLD